MEESRLLYCISCGKYVNIGIIQNFSGRKYYIFSMCSTPVPFVFRAGFALYQRSHFQGSVVASHVVFVLALCNSIQGGEYNNPMWIIVADAGATVNGINTLSLPFSRFVCCNTPPSSLGNRLSMLLFFCNLPPASARILTSGCWRRLGGCVRSLLTYTPNGCILMGRGDSNGHS